MSKDPCFCSALSIGSKLFFQCCWLQHLDLASTLETCSDSISHPSPFLKILFSSLLQDEECRASQFNNNDDPEYFAYECLTVANVEKIFNESIETVQKSLGVSHGRAKQILHANKWNIPDIMAKFTPVVSSQTGPPPSSSPGTLDTQFCPVCVLDLPSNQFTSLKLVKRNKQTLK